MTTRIFKYPLEATDVQYLELPARAQFLTVQVQNGIPCLWALVDPTQKKELRRIRTIGTGHPIENDFDSTYLATYQLPGLVFHVFYR